MRMCGESSGGPQTTEQENRIHTEANLSKIMPGREICLCLHSSVGCMQQAAFCSSENVTVKEQGEGRETKSDLFKKRTPNTDTVRSIPGSSQPTKPDCLTPRRKLTIPVSKKMWTDPGSSDRLFRFRKRGEFTLEGLRTAPLGLLRAKNKPNEFFYL